MSTASISRSRALAMVAVAAVVSTLAVASITSLTAASAAPAQKTAFTPKALALHDAMRDLWQSHGTWTERAIVDFVGGLPDTNLVVARLLQNQVDIGNAVKPYYGRKAGNQLTKLLKAHINDAVAVLAAAKSGDAAATAKAKAAFYANGNEVASFLHAANPTHWSLPAMKTMMRIHLDQVIALAVDQLKGNYKAAIGEYDVYIGHILDMADMLSTGIVQQFPARFR
ncbi:MAG: hypothetical protein ACJ75G_06995 [Gaiellaceae bacterium]